MIRLTVLHYKLKTPSLERYHNISTHYDKLLNEWENDISKSQDTGVDYPPKPFEEPFEFEDDDYIVTEESFRIRAEDILYYMTNIDGATEIHVSEKIFFIVKETVEEVDKMLEKLHK